MKTLDEQLQIWKEFEDGPTQVVSFDGLSSPVFIKRLDLIQSWASGNKYFKLKYPMLDAIENKKKIIVSKGGPNSNHLEALVSSCKNFGLEPVCIIRSFQSDPDNPTVAFLRNNGASLHFLAPDEYQSFDKKDADALYPGCMFIPEGGFNEYGVTGAKEIYSMLGRKSYSHLVIPGGTMTTVAGILSVADRGIKIIIVPAWKACTREYVNNVLESSCITPHADWEIWPDYHFGGFAKYSDELAGFMLSFTRERGIPLDPVYTGKMMYALVDKMRQGYFNATDKIICIHTGGLQGIGGFNHRDPAVWNAYFKLTTKN